MTYGFAGAPFQLLMKLLGDKNQTHTHSKLTIGQRLIRDNSPRLIYINSLIHILIDSNLPYRKL